MLPTLKKCDSPKIYAISIPAFQCRTRQINSRVGQNIDARKGLSRIKLYCAVHELPGEKCGLFNLQADMHWE